MHTGAILAGGQCRRMGRRPKPFLEIGGVRIIDLQLAVLRQVTDKLALVSNDRELYEGFGIPVWTDRKPGHGPLGGIYTALVNAATPVTLVVAGDMPFLTVDFLEYLADEGKHADIAIPDTTDGLQPLCATYSQNCIEPIQQHLKKGKLKVKDLLSTVRVSKLSQSKINHFDPDGKLFLNINTPEEYATSLHIAQHSKSN